MPLFQFRISRLSERRLRRSHAFVTFYERPYLSHVDQCRNLLVRAYHRQLAVGPLCGDVSSNQGTQSSRIHKRDVSEIQNNLLGRFLARCRLKSEYRMNTQRTAKRQYFLPFSVALR